MNRTKKTLVGGFRGWTLTGCLLTAVGLIAGAGGASASASTGASTVDGPAPQVLADSVAGPAVPGALNQSRLASDPPVTGGANALVITVDLDGTDQFPKPDLQGVTSAQVVHDTIDATRPWFQHESHGVFAGFFALARGPVNVQTTSRNVCQGDWLNEIADKADAAVKLHEPALDLNQYNAVIYYFGSVAPCAAQEAGWGELSGKRIWLDGDHSARTAVHEFGHHLGLGHAGAQHCLTPAGAEVPLSGNCSTDEYGDVFSAMGSTGAALTDEYSPFQQAELGWNQAWTSTAHAGDPPKTYFLTPAEDDPAAGTTQTLRLLDNAGEDLWLDFHRIATGPTFGFTNYTNGLLVRRETNPLAPSPALLFMGGTEGAGINTVIHPNMLVGQSWTNPLGTMTITLNSADATGASVTIQSPPLPPPPGSVVPNLIGMQPNAAGDAVLAAGLVVGAVSTHIDCENLSTVISQSPSAGTFTPTGFTVNYTYGIAPRNGCGTPN